jgi:RNA polymerase sigma factor (sigma-70 family)
LRFDADLQQAAEKYELMRRQLIKFFECRNCEFAYELTDESINRVTRKISEGEDIPANALSAYFYGVARNVLREFRLNPEKNAISIDHLEAFQHPSENPLTVNLERAEKNLAEQLLQCLDGCLQELPEKERKIILVYYEGEYGARIENRKKVARRFRMNINNLRIRVFRIRAKLEQCVALCRNKSAAG